MPTAYPQVIAQWVLTTRACCELSAPETPRDLSTVQRIRTVCSERGAPVREKFCNSPLFSLLVSQWVLKNLPVNKWLFVGCRRHRQPLLMLLSILTGHWFCSDSEGNVSHNESPALLLTTPLLQQFRSPM